MFQFLVFILFYFIYIKFQKKKRKQKKKGKKKKKKKSEKWQVGACNGTSVPLVFWTTKHLRGEVLGTLGRFENF